MVAKTVYYASYLVDIMLIMSKQPPVPNPRTQVTFIPGLFGTAKTARHPGAVGKVDARIACLCEKPLLQLSRNLTLKDHLLDYCKICGTLLTQPHQRIMLHVVLENIILDIPRPVSWNQFCFAQFQQNNQGRPDIQNIYFLRFRRGGILSF